jgi:hypothetical protein
MLEAVVVETRRQLTGIGVIRSLNAIITTIGVETVIMPTDVVERRRVIGFATNLGRGLGGFLTKRNLNKSSKLPIKNIRIVGTPQMVLTSPIMTTHVHKTTNQPSMSSITARRYKSIDVENPKGGYQYHFS